MNLSDKNLDFKYLMKHQGELSKNLADKKVKKVVEYDFRMVSFKIGHEYFGINIMNVKEILKENKFTRVPNALDFVIGVLNLRGEIISVIDLAKMFHLDILEEQDEEKNKLRSIVVIKVEDLLIGLVVEQIQRVISFRKDDMQPPSPLLGKINEKYIEGVAEINERLYVIFNTDAIFSAKEKSKKDVLPNVSDLSEEFFIYFYNQIEEFSSIHINQFSKVSFTRLYNQYAIENNITDLPVITKEISDNILNKFYSKHTRELWQQPYVDQFMQVVIPELNKICSEKIRILVIGCGNGHEAFSLFIMLNENFKDIEIKMVASDLNLSAISNASGFEISKENIHSWINRDKYFMKLSGGMYKIKKEINNKIYFEFHDARNIGSYSREFDIVIARDLSLHLSVDDYITFLNDVCKKIISGGVLIIGDNEIIENHIELSKINNKYISIYKRK